MARIEEITQDSFRALVQESPLPVLVEFGATWCGPCRMIVPALEGLAGDYEGRVKVAQVDVDAQPALAQAFGVQSLPTLILFRSGKVVGGRVGYAAKPELARLVEGAFAQA